MSKNSKEIFEFSQFRLELAERRLTRNGKVVRLPDKAFETLAELVRRGGELVTKDELMNVVWPDSVVEENNLDQKISTLRTALGERGRNKVRFIETVRGHGYRFISPVSLARLANGEKELRANRTVPPQRNLLTNAEPLPIETRTAGNVVKVAAWQPQFEEHGTAAGADPIPPEEAVKGGEAADRLIWLLKVGLGCIVMISIVGIAWNTVSFSDRGRPYSTSQIESIAVLPFVNETGDPDIEYLSDGLTDSVIVRLSQVPGLQVKARNSVFRYKGSDIDIQKAGTELSAHGVLTGDLSKRGDELILVLELIDSRSGNVIWRDRYVREVTDFVTLERDIARDVANQLRSRLSQADQGRVARPHTADPEANRLFLQGLYHWNKRTAHDIRKSIDLFQQAADRDPAFAKAYAWLGMAYLLVPEYSHGLKKLEIEDLHIKRAVAMERARALDDTLPEIYVLSATLKEDRDWDFKGSENDYRRAIELDPNFATAYHALSRTLGGALGRYDEAIAMINKAHELDPFSRSIAFNIGGRFADARRFDEAIAQYKRVLEMEPDHPLTHLVLGRAYDAKRMYSEAIDSYRTAEVLLEKLSQADADEKAAALIASLKIGEKGYWKKRLEYARADLKSGVGSNVNIAGCLAMLGEMDEALRHLEIAFAGREHELIWIRSDHSFDVLSKDPRFDDLLRRVGVKS